MVTNPDGRHWCDQPQVFKSLGEAEKCAKDVSENGKCPHAIWNIVAVTAVDIVVSLKSI